jgi:hypothetical protein
MKVNGSIIIETDMVDILNRDILDKKLINFPGI